MRKPIGLTAPYREDDDDIQDYKKPWVGLTDEEIQMCWDGVMDGAVFRKRDIYNAIEAKLKEKNA